MKKIHIRDLDVIYLSFDEPQKEEFWAKILNIVPWAKRIDGVKGSDNAHKAAAECSETDRFIVIDGDNLPDESFFEKFLLLDELSEKAQFRWRSKNIINNLYYGNGGLSCWTKSFVMNMKTHENTDGSDHTNIEFCFDPLYWALHDCYSVTYPNYSPKQAWRAGFREGVKLCTRSGVVPPSISEFKKWVWERNLNNLSIWQNIGRDVSNGFWAILGARTGTHYLMLNKNWDHTEVRDFDLLDKLWVKHSNDDESVCRDIGKDLTKYLKMDICELDSDSSMFFKKHFNKKYRNYGFMVKEIDVIRQEEGLI